MVQKCEQTVQFKYHFGVLHRGNKDSVAAAHRRSPVSRRDSAAAMLRRSETPIFIGSQKRLFSVDFGSAASLAGPPRAAAAAGCCGSNTPWHKNNRSPHILIERKPPRP
jgi:hypothetical protein